MEYERFRVWMAALAAVAILSSCKSRGSSLDDLVRAAGEMPNRPIAARLSGGFVYHPIAVRQRGIAVPAPPLTLLQAASRLAIAAQRDPSPVSLHRAAESYLLTGKANEAVAALEESLQSETRESDIQVAIAKSTNFGAISDLAAAYLTRASGTDSLDVLAAMNAAERAWRLARTPEAGWNRALAMSAASSREAALAAWNDVIAMVPGAEWSTEARVRMQNVRNRGPVSRPEVMSAIATALRAGPDGAVAHAVALGPGYARLMIEDDLLSQWAAGDSGSLDDAARIAAAIARISNDFVAADTVTQIRSVHGTDAVAEDEIRTGITAFARGRRALLGYQYERALPLFMRAAASLVPHDVALGNRASMFVATLHFYAQHNDASLSICDDIVHLNNISRYPSIKAQCVWNAGTIAANRRDFDRARAAFAQARSIFVDMDDINDVAAIDVRFEENERYAGDVASAWSHMTTAFANGAEERGYIPLSEAAKVAQAARMPFAALAFYGAAIDAARGARSIAEQADGSVLRAQLLWRLGSEDAALKELDTAARFMSSISDHAVAARLESYFVIARAEVSVAAQPREVVRDMEALVPELALNGNRRKLAEAEYLQAKANLELGRRGEAERSVRASLAEIELQRTSTSIDEERLALMDTGREAAEMLVALLYDEGRTDDALQAAEEAKAQLLLNAIGSRAPTRRNVMVSPSNGEALVDMFMAGDRLLIWTITRSSGRRATAVAIDRHEIGKRIDAWQRALAGNDSRRVSTGGAALFDQLLHPIWRDIASSRKLVFASDDVLHRLAFAALPIPGAHSLVEDYDISHVPSLMWLAAEAETATAKPLRRVVVVIVANTNASDASYEPLPSVEEDARSIAQRFPGTTVITGEAANVDYVASAIRDVDLFHFAGHAVVDDKRPSRSALIMRDGRAWRASSIAEERLTGSPLVFLAACSTGAGPVTSDGTASIARAFLLAGSRGAVSTLWAVNDDEAAYVANLFYGGLARGEEASGALAAAQRAAIRMDKFHSSHAWAAFEYIGL